MMVVFQSKENLKEIVWSYSEDLETYYHLFLDFYWFWRCGYKLFSMSEPCLSRSSCLLNFTDLGLRFLYCLPFLSESFCEGILLLKIINLIDPS